MIFIRLLTLTILTASSFAFAMCTDIPPYDDEWGYNGSEICKLKPIKRMQANNSWSLFPNSGSSTSKSEYCTPEYLIPRIVADSILGKVIPDSFIPQLVHATAFNQGNPVPTLNPFPNVNDIWDRCIGCVLDEATGGGKSCDEVWGDPHLITRDGLKYDFQGAGDYWLVKSEEYGIQARFSRPAARKSVSELRAIAIRIPGVTIAVGDEPLSVDDYVSSIRINQKKVLVDSVSWAHFDGGTVWRQDDDVLIKTDLGVGLRVNLEKTYFKTSLPNGKKDSTTGLLGNGDEDPKNDLKNSDGSLVHPKDHKTLYGKFLQSWSVPNKDSFFTTEGNLGYNGPVIPEKILTLETLDRRDQSKARQICLDNGFAENRGLRECIFDVAATGDEKYAKINNQLKTQELEVISDYTDISKEDLDKISRSDSCSAVTSCLRCTTKPGCYAVISEDDFFVACANLTRIEDKSDPLLEGLTKYTSDPYWCDSICQKIHTKHSNNKEMERLECTTGYAQSPSRACRWSGERCVNSLFFLDRSVVAK